MDEEGKHKKIKIDTLIISDIHLGDSTTRCEEILKVLSEYEYDRLILNGDIIEGLKLERLHTGHWQVLSAFRKLSRLVEVIWIHGNHDAKADVLYSLLGVRIYNKYIWRSAGKKFLVIHGHQYDRLLHKNYLISRIAYVIYDRLRYIDRGGYLTGLIKKHSTTWERSSQEVAQGALRLARRRRANFVFCGHTHKIYSTEKKGIKYFNTGCWIEKPSAYVTITGDKVELVRVK